MLSVISFAPITTLLLTTTTMADVYFEDCISLTRRFGPTQDVKAIDSDEPLAVRRVSKNAKSCTNACI